MTPDQPAHPLYALTTYELRTYRRDLEHALRTLPEHAADRERVKVELAGVLAEQESRVALAAAAGR
jgi:hypothetical protein